LDILEQNLAALAGRQPELARILGTVALHRIELVASRKGLPTCFFHRDAGDPVPLHSRYDPMQEARVSLKETNLEDSDYLIFLGFGLGYRMDAVLERVDRNATHFFIVESDPEILLAAFMARDLTSLISLPHIHFAWPAEGNGLARQWQGFFDPVRARKSAYINHPPSLALNPDLFKSAANIINSKTLQIFADISTAAESWRVFLANFVANFRQAAGAPGVRTLQRVFPGVPAILVAAGPSLDRNIHELRHVQDRVLILATDTALKPLLASEIEPHFVLSGDPRRENYLHLDGAVTRETLLVSEATAFPGTFAAFAGRTIVCTYEKSSLRALSEVLACKGVMHAWGSVATMCLDFALLLGCSPIIFVGQDLAFSSGRTYCSGLYWDENRFAGVHSPEDWERRWAEIRAPNRIVMTEDLFGRPVASTDKLMSYWNWISGEIEKHPEVHFINATEGGILRDKLEILSLREALFRFCREPLDLGAKIRRLFAKAAHEDSQVDLALLARLKEESGKLMGILEVGLRLCRETNADASSRKLQLRLERAKQSVYSLIKLAPLLDCVNQIGNINFLRRQSALASQPHPEGRFGEIRDVYLEYFQSLSNASHSIADGLSQIHP
jgi:hypothetical protein